MQHMRVLVSNQYLVLYLAGGASNICPEHIMDAKKYMPDHLLDQAIAAVRAATPNAVPPPHLLADLERLRPPPLPHLTRAAAQKLRAQEADELSRYEVAQFFMVEVLPHLPAGQLAGFGYRDVGDAGVCRPRGWRLDLFHASL